MRPKLKRSTVRWSVALRYFGKFFLLINVLDVRQEWGPDGPDSYREPGSVSAWLL